MTFATPIWLLGLLPVAAVAVVVFVRPIQRQVVVGSLALWLQAIHAAGDTGGRIRRRMPAGWVLLLTGATLAVLALCQPTMHWPSPANPESATQIPAEIPAISFDALAGCSLPDGRVEVLARLANTSEEPFAGTLTITPRNAPSLANPISIPAGDSSQFIFFTQQAQTIHVEVKNSTGEVLATENLQNTPAAVTHIAVMGNTLSALQRYIQADPRLMLVADPAQADVVLAQGVIPPVKKAALVLAPPAPPPGWRQGEDILAVTFASADVAADPVMRNVNVAAMAVRRVTPWQLAVATSDVVLLSLDNQAIIVRTTPERDTEGDRLRRVYVAFAITQDNTNIDEIPAPFVTLLANAIRWLHPVPGTQNQYLCERGSFKSSWHLQEREDSKSLPVLEGAPAENQEAPTSSKTSLKVPLELSPWLIAAAMLCWIAGWWRMGRKAG